MISIAYSFINKNIKTVEKEKFQYSTLTVTKQNSYFTDRKISIFNRFKFP